MQENEKKFQKGVELLRAEKFEAALKIFNELITEFPNNADYWSERGVVHFHMQNRKASLIDMDKAVELEPKKSYRYSSRAYILGHYKQTEKAVADYQKAIELDPEDAIAHNNLGLLEEQMGYEKKAKQRYAKADELGKDLNIDGRSDQGIEGEKIEARNIQKEIEEARANQSLWKELKAITTKEGRASFLKFIKSGFKDT